MRKTLEQFLDHKVAQQSKTSTVLAPRAKSQATTFMTQSRNNSKDDLSYFKVKKDDEDPYNLSFINNNSKVDDKQQLVFPKNHNYFHKSYFKTINHSSAMETSPPPTLVVQQTPALTVSGGAVGSKTPLTPP
jgi:hypothetical protein